MSNVIKFPVKGDNGQPNSKGGVHDIVHGIVGGLYIVLVILWVPIRFLLIANTVIQFFAMLFKLDQGVLFAAWPFILNFLVLAILTYVMATWKPKSCL